jgi:putative transposase
MKRMAYLRRLDRLTKKYGRDDIVYVDESGFKKHSYRQHGWTRRGQIIYGEVSGNNRKATNLIMAQRNGRWFAPETFEGNCNTVRVNEWLLKTLIPKLDKPSIVVMDNAPFHNKKQIKAILKKAGHAFLPLPPYSPDFNPIENSFGTIKKIREFSPPDTPILNILKSSDYYWE